VEAGRTEGDWGRRYPAILLLCAWGNLYLNLHGFVDHGTEVRETNKNPRRGSLGCQQPSRLTSTVGQVNPYFFMTAIGLQFSQGFLNMVVYFQNRECRAGRAWRGGWERMAKWQLCQESPCFPCVV
jgi:hypothetical protein